MRDISAEVWSGRKRSRGGDRENGRKLWHLVPRVRARIKNNVGLGLGIVQGKLECNVGCTFFQSKRLMVGLNLHSVF